MRRRALAGLLLSALAFVGCSSVERASARLHGEDGIVGVAVFEAVGEGTRATINVAGLEHDAELHAVVNAGTCEEPGASALALPGFVTDEHGRGRMTARLTFRGEEDVALETLTGDPHAVRLFEGEHDVACGQI